MKLTSEEKNIYFWRHLLSGWNMSSTFLRQIQFHSLEIYIFCSSFKTCLLRNVEKWKSDLSTQVQKTLKRILYCENIFQTELTWAPSSSKWLLSHNWASWPIVYIEIASWMTKYFLGLFNKWSTWYKYNTLNYKNKGKHVILTRLT